MRHHVRFPGGKGKALTLSYDDGVETDVRLIEIMKKNGLYGAFNLNSECFVPEGTVHPEGKAQRLMSKSQIIKTFTDSGMEVACHTCTHPFLEKLSSARCTYELIKDRDNLEKLFGVIVRGCAYPFGTYNQDVIEAARACGLAYCRTTNGNRKFDIPEEPLAWVPTCHHDCPELFELLDTFLSAKVVNDPKIFYLWGHSYEFDAHHNWERIEEFAEKAGGHDDVWYATNIEIIDYINAVRSLVFSADGFIVNNPTATDVWIYISGNAFYDRAGTYFIPAGATIKLKEANKVF